MCLPYQTCTVFGLEGETAHYVLCKLMCYAMMFFAVGPHLLCVDSVTGRVPLNALVM